MSQAGGTRVPSTEEARPASKLGGSRPAQRPLNHDEFPDILCRYQTDQLLVEFNRKHGTLTILKPRKGLDNLKIALHTLTSRKIVDP